MGQEESSQEKHGIPLDQLNLPLVGKRYKMVAVLGGGAFGRVYKVEDVSSKAKHKPLYAMKSVSYKTKDVSEKQQKKILESAETEVNLLSRLNHESIVKLIASFTIGHNPMNPREKIKHFCCIIEYIRGSDLNDILQKLEDNKNFVIPADLSIFWFIKLLDTLQHIHSESIIHRDMKPDNILVSYQSLSDRKQMSLKISDFGVGKLLKEGERGHTISGQLFYTAPEVIRQIPEGYDDRADIWSLGIIFMQVYSQISINTYQKSVHDIFKGVRADAKMNKKFCKRFKMENMESVGLLPLLVFMHENDLFYPIIPKFVMDPGVAKVLKHMLCPMEKRWSAKKILEHPVVKTWQFILNERTQLQKTEFDVLGIITFLQVERDPLLFDRCLDLLKEHVGTNPEEFIDSNGIVVLLKRLTGIKSLFQRKYLEPIVTVLMKILMYYVKKDDLMYESILRVTSVHLRNFRVLDSLLALLKAQNNSLIIYFCSLLASQCKTMRMAMAQYVTTVVQKMDKSTLPYSIALLSYCAQHMKLDDLKRVTANQKIKSLYFLKRVECKAELAGIVISRVYKDLAEKRSLEHNLLLLNFFLQDLDKLCIPPTHMKLLFEKAPGKGIKMKIQKNLHKPFVIFHDRVTFTNMLDRRKVFIELISTEPVCPARKLVLDKDQQAAVEEYAVAFYEFDVLNGGIKDDLFFGLTTTYKQILLHGESGHLGFYDVVQGEVSQIRYEPLYAHTGDTIGVGLTNKGKVFFTRNKKMLKPVVEFLSDGDNLKKGIYASLKLKNNRGFKAKLNFGAYPFMFPFTEIIPKPYSDAAERENESHSYEQSVLHKKIWVYQKCVNTALEIDKGGEMVKLIQASSEKKSKLYNLCAQCLYAMGARKKKPKIDTYLTTKYVGADEFKGISKRFMKENILNQAKNLSVKERLFAKYKHLQDRQMHAAAGSSEDAQKRTKRSHSSAVAEGVKKKKKRRGSFLARLKGK